MPRIPDVLAHDALPATGGQPSGIVQAPAIPLPGVDAQAATAGARGLGALGEGVSQAGAQAIQAEHYQALRQRAQDTLDSHISAQHWDQRFISQWDTLQRGPYQTLPEDVEAAGRQLLADVSVPLNPQARAMVQGHVEEQITQWKLKAEGIRTAQQNEEVSFATIQAIATAQQRYLAATTEMEKTLAKAPLVTFVGDMVHRRLRSGEWGADILTKTDLQLKQADAQKAILANPQGAVDDLQRVAQGEEPTTPAFRGLPVTMLAPLSDYAYAHMRERVTVRDQQERYALVRIKALQDGNEVKYRQKLYAIDARPENLLALQALTMEINTAGVPQADGRIPLSKEGHSALMTLGQALVEKALYPRPQPDHEPTKLRLASQLALAQTPDDFAQLRADFTQAIPQLTAGTIKEFSQSIDQKIDASYFGHWPTVQFGWRAIQESAFPPGTLIMPQMLKEPEHHRLLNAYDAYYGRLQQMMDDPTVHDKRASINQAAPRIADEVRQQFIEEPIRRPDDLPIPLRKETDAAKAWWFIQGLGLPDAQSGRLYRQWEAINTLRATQGTAPAQAPPAALPPLKRSR